MTSGEMITFQCYYCGQGVRAPKKAENRKARCPKCSRSITVPNEKVRKLRAARQAETGTLTAEQAKAVLQMHQQTDQLKAQTQAQRGGYGGGSSLGPGFRMLGGGYGGLGRTGIMQVGKNFIFYDKPTLLMMVVVAVLVALTSHEALVEDAKKAARFDVYAIVIVCGIVLGFFFTVYHIFTWWEKSEFEKKLIIFFAAGITGVTAVYAGISMISAETPRYLLVLPLYNLVYGGIMLVLLWENAISEEVICDKHISLGRFVSAVVMAGAVFGISHYVFAAHWAITYTVCIAFATSFEKAFREVIFPASVAAD